MCIKRYHTSKGSANVRTVKADKETDHSIYINGRRRAKHGQWDNYYNTFAEAKEAMVTRAMNNVKGCHARLTAAQTFLHKAQTATHSPPYLTGVYITLAIIMAG